MTDDLTEIEAKIGELEERRRKAMAMGGEKKLAKRRNTGELNARERIEHLVDESSFLKPACSAPLVFTRKITT